MPPKLLDFLRHMPYKELQWALQKKERERKSRNKKELFKGFLSERETLEIKSKTNQRGSHVKKNA